METQIRQLLRNYLYVLKKQLREIPKENKGDIEFTGDEILKVESILTDTVKATYQLLAAAPALMEALQKIVDSETECCLRCEGNGRLYADGKAHYMSEGAPTIFCGNCGGSGRLQPENAQEIAQAAIALAEKGAVQ